ncbi:hypothetical protein LNP24_28135 [Klebsiella pneumoniae subsp. pneumoniae]|nr:hypothetical protein [Klebsiella pneumoniae subsp. pneumoniae]
MISEDITREAEDIIHSLQTEPTSDDPSTLRLVRALRVSEAAFVDDGAVRAVDLLDKIEDGPANPDLRVLEKAARWRSGKPLNFLPELRGTGKHHCSINICPRLISGQKNQERMC